MPQITDCYFWKGHSLTSALSFGKAALKEDPTTQNLYTVRSHSPGQHNPYKHVQRKELFHEVMDQFFTFSL